MPITTYSQLCNILQGHLVKKLSELLPTLNTLLFTAKINNKDVPYVGLKEYDAKQWIFILRLKGEGFPEGVSREIYDVKTRKFHGKSSYPDGAKEESMFQIINKNNRLFETQVKKDGKVIFTRKATFTRVTQDHPNDGN